MSETVAASAVRAGTPARPRLGALRRFLKTESGGALILLASALLAIAWVNSPWSGGYHALWSTPVALQWGDYRLAMDLGHWVNDGLMTFFFLLIGLEVRREFDMGEFRDRRRVAVPVTAAAGGILLPVAIFLSLNAGTEAAGGWGVVMATDTAFAMGVLAAVGHRSSFRLRTFLLTLVIVDDIAAVTVIAVVYSRGIEPGALALALALLGAMAILRRIGVQQPTVHVLLGIGIWLATLEAGIHPSVAGVTIGLLTGAHPPRRAVLERATSLGLAYRQQPSAELAAAAARGITLSLSPNERAQYALHGFSSYFVVPMFALANAGLELRGDLIGRAFESPLVAGIVLGLVVGKTVGIPLGAWLATRPWLGGQALSVGWPSLIAASAAGGIGFTMSLLIAELSYAGPMLDHAKLGILTASVLAGALAIALFHGMEYLPAEWLRRAEAGAALPVPDLIDPVDPERDHVRGPIDAPLTLLQYGDYECMDCAPAAGTVDSLLARFDGRLRLVFRHLPLVDVHPNAALAAEAAEAAGSQGRFWEMHDLLFEHYDALDLHDLLRYAGGLGLDCERFEDELRSGQHSARIGRDVNSAEQSGVAGVPAFFINGVRHHGPYDFDSLEEAIARASRTVELRLAAGASTA